MQAGRYHNAAPILPASLLRSRQSTHSSLDRVCLLSGCPNKYGLLKLVKKARMQSPTCALLTQASIEDLSNNQVLMAVLTASLIGQLLKPFTAALRGKGFNWKLVISSGGMPSAHSACVTAACTSIALERGLPDPLFGLSIVFAGIVMYDAQGVRRAVGKQAEVINTLVVGSSEPADPIVAQYKQCSTVLSGVTDEQGTHPVVANIQSMDSIDAGNRDSSFSRPQKFMEIAERLPSVEAGQVSLQEIGDMDGWRHIPLKESVGHTKLEVLVGGAWGVISTLALNQFTGQTMHF